MGILTKKVIADKFGGDVFKAIMFIENELSGLREKNIVRPSKPSLPSNHSAAEAKAYAQKLELYELDMKSYKVSDDAYRKVSHDYYAALDEYLQDESGLNTTVPEKYRSKVRARAWSEGHANGYGEYYNILVDLVSIFE